MVNYPNSFLSGSLKPRRQALSLLQEVGYSAKQRKGRLVGTFILQNSPDTWVSGLSVPRDAHTGFTPYGSAPLTSRDLLCILIRRPGSDTGTSRSARGCNPHPD